MSSPITTSLISRARAPPNRRSSTCSMNPQPGEIWLADLGLAAKTRPVVIVSRQDPDPPRSLVLYVPLTTQRRIEVSFAAHAAGHDPAGFHHFEQRDDDRFSPFRFAQNHLRTRLVAQRAKHPTRRTP